MTLYNWGYHLNQHGKTLLTSGPKKVLSKEVCSIPHFAIMHVGQLLPAPEKVGPNEWCALL